jgi:hypothetical protein
MRLTMTWTHFVRACACIGAVSSGYVTLIAICAVMGTPWTGALDMAWIYGAEFGPLMLVVWWRLYLLRRWAGWAFCLVGAILVWQNVAWDYPFPDASVPVMAGVTAAMVISLRGTAGIWRGGF